MNKLVYLFEMDSVRSTDSEVKKAQEVLYEELVTNGNTVVLSFNQLTDSRAFLAILHNSAYYNFVQEQFIAGRMRFSRYKDYRTASQYVQNTILRNLDASDDKFIYSALPVKSNQKFLLELMRQVLVNDDIGALSENIEMAKAEDESVLALFPEQRAAFNALADADADTDADAAAAHRTAAQCKIFQEVAGYLETLKRFLQFVITVSMSDAAPNPAVDFDKTPEYNLCATINRVLEFEPLGENGTLWKEAIKPIYCIMTMYDSDTEKSDKNNRSNWHSKLKAYSENPESGYSRESLQMAELIIDLCHNYTIERSIHNISRHYGLMDDSYGSMDSDYGTMEKNAENTSIGEKKQGSFRVEFFSRLDHEWQKGAEAEERYLQTESNEYVPYLESHVNWEQASRIIHRRTNGRKSESKSPECHSSPSKQDCKSAECPGSASNQDFKSPEGGIPQYEYEHNLQRQQKKKEDAKNIAKVFAMSLLYIVAIVAVDLGVSAAEDLAGDVITVSVPVIKSVLIFLIIMILTGILDKIASLPDLEECVEMLKTVMVDIKAILTSKETAYVNKENLGNSEKSDSLPSKRQGLIKSKALKEYINLYNTRKELFGVNEEEIQIVKPDDAGCREICEYEVLNHKQIGVLYKSKYNMLVVDLVKGREQKEYFTYERIVTAVRKGAVVMVTMWEGKFVLIRQFRHAIRRIQMAFPRGYGEEGISVEENAGKELKEELGVGCQGTPKLLGNVVADSGLSNGTASVFLVTLDGRPPHTEVYKPESVPSAPSAPFTPLEAFNEGILGVVMLTEEEMNAAIASGEIDDGYTLAAIALYHTLKED